MTQTCTNKCICSGGKKRLECGDCVDECPLDCPEGEIPLCIDPCSEKCDPRGCTSPPECIRQCACPPGHKRLADGTCVVESTCPLICPANEEASCVIPCTEYCGSTACSGVDMNQPCTDKCICSGGKKRSGSGACLDECPLECPMGETPQCIDPCQNLCDSQSCQSPPACVQTCLCPTGQKRLANGTCVSQCPLICPTLESSGCAIPCNEFCYNECTAAQLAQPCTTKCVCNGSRKRARNGTCVETNRCCTGDDESYINSGSRCLENCGNSNCGTVFRVPGCFCTNNHCRQNGECRNCRPTDRCTRSFIQSVREWIQPLF